MEKYRKTEILQIVEEEGVEFIRLQFTDMFGTLKNVAVPVSCLEKAMDDRCTIDLASLNGFAKEEETELYLKPDFSTFTILPWRPQNGKVARFRIRRGLSSYSLPSSVHTSHRKRATFPF